MRIYRFVAKMAEVEGRIAPPFSATSAADTALGLRPRRALSSAQLPAECTIATLLCNHSSCNGNYPLNSVSHRWGAVHLAPPPPPPPLHPHPPPLVLIYPPGVT